MDAELKECELQAEQHLGSQELFIETALLLTGDQQREAIRNIARSSFGTGWRSARVQRINEKMY